MAMEKTFDPASIEAKWAQHWEANGLFRPHRPDATPYTIVNPPPNVTGALHIGHALDNTLQDVLIRYERLRGKDALWVVGMDHAGIATQMVVERQLEAQGDKRANYTREQFIEKVWQWKAESGGQITGQLRRLGCSMDWANERFTMDEGLNRAVAKVFVDLYNAGLIYRDKRLVNWDPKLKTAISDLEVETREVQGKFWHFKYPLADGVTLDSGADHVVVATTRPETMLADMAVAVNPADPRYQSVIGNFVTLPITGRRIPIIADDHADPELGSGAVKITPGHDFNDFEVGKRAGFTPAAMLNMFDAEARVVEIYDVSRWASAEELGKERGRLHRRQTIPNDLVGLDRFAARDAVVAEMVRLGLLAHVEDRTIQTPYGDRSGVVIEPWLTDQWYVDAKTLAQPAIDAVRDGRINIVPKTWEKTWFNWLENIQPWCVSRQLWWGHRIPVWYGPNIAFFEEGDATQPDKSFVASTEDEALRQARVYYASAKDASGATIRVELDTEWSPAEGVTVRILRDPDVLDTWFSSALWPFATLGWPDTASENRHPGLDPGSMGPSITATPSPVASPAPWTPDQVRGDEGGQRLSATAPTPPRSGEGVGSVDQAPRQDEIPHPNPSPEGEGLSHGLLARHYPNDVLISGFDILFFWDARMAMQGLHFMGEKPWKTLYLHGLVRAPDGSKMAKSKGNVVNPIGLIDQYGADALRFFMAAMESQGRDIKMDEARLAGYRNFATKLWNAARFCEANGIGASATLAAPPAALAVNRWIIGEVADTVAAVDAALAAFRFDEAANTVYHFAWDRFCDWYLELIKPVLSPATAGPEPVEGPIAQRDGERGGAEAAGAIPLHHPADGPPPRSGEELETRAVAGWVLDQILVMLHPFMPFITEELWSARGVRADYPLITALWPDPRAQGDAAAKADIEWLIALVSELRAAKAELGIAPGARLTAHIPASLTTRAGALAGALDRTARLDRVTSEPAPPGASAQLVVAGETITVPLDGVIDIAAERARLAKALEAASKARDSLAARLANPAFAERAKAEAVAKARSDLAAKTAEADRLGAALARLG